MAKHKEWSEQCIICNRVKQAVKEFKLEIEKIIVEKTDNLYADFDSGKWQNITDLIHNCYKELYGDD